MAMARQEHLHGPLALALLGALLLGPIGCDEVASQDAAWPSDTGTPDAQGGEVIQETLGELDAGEAPPETVAAEALDEPQAEPLAETTAEVLVPTGWRDAEIEELRAPERDRVTVTFDRELAPETVLVPEAYRLDSDWGPLEIKTLYYNENARRLDLGTEPQALGITYTLSIDTGDGGRVLQASTLSAESARFWVSDELDAGFAQKQITAQRLAAGETCVVYVEEGNSLEGTTGSGSGPNDIALEFDAHIHPILTQLFVDAPDVDGNARIVILGMDGGDAFGGYVNPINQYPDDYIYANYGMHSNEMEIIHINTRIDAWSVPSTTAHEFEHLLYHARHGLEGDYWEYHDEGLAECAVHAVYGYNERAVDYYHWDPYGILAPGLSLVNWTYAQYENYVQAYLFWVYLAAQLSGDESGFWAIFNLDSGHPATVNAMLLEELGTTLPILHMMSMAAVWVQDASGPYGFQGMLPQQGGAAPTVPPGTSSVDLQPFSGVFFRLDQAEVDYPAPGAYGEDILYLGINGAGQVDLDAPFDIDGGVLLAYNLDFEYSLWPTQASGPGTPTRLEARTSQAPRPYEAGGLERFPRWTNPPPAMPHQDDAWRRWRSATRARRQLELPHER